MVAKCAAPSNPIAMWPSSAKTLRSRPGPQPKSRIVKGLSLSMCCNNAAMLVVDIFCTKHFAAQFEATVEYVAHRFSVIFAHFLLHLVKGKVRNNITSRSRLPRKHHGGLVWWRASQRRTFGLLELLL